RRVRAAARASRSAAGAAWRRPAPPTRTAAEALRTTCKRRRGRTRRTRPGSRVDTVDPVLFAVDEVDLALGPEVEARERARRESGVERLHERAVLEAEGVDHARRRVGDEREAAGRLDAARLHEA